MPEISQDSPFLPLLALLSRGKQGLEGMVVGGWLLH